MKVGAWAVAIAILGQVLVGCTKSQPTASVGSPEGADLVFRGKQIYQAYCIQCHNANPALDGGVGPANAGASKELLDWKILKGAYPPGYTGKRSTQLMAKMPDLEKHIEALHAYLQSVPAASK